MRFSSIVLLRDIVPFDGIPGTCVMLPAHPGLLACLIVHTHDFDDSRKMLMPRWHMLMQIQQHIMVRARIKRCLQNHRTGFSQFGRSGVATMRNKVEG